MKDPVVGHVIHNYLPRSETFVYTLLRNQAEFQPVVFTRFTSNVDEFPIARLRELKPDKRIGPRARRRVARLGRGRWGTTYAYELVGQARAARCALLHAHFGPTGSRSLPAARQLELPLVTTFYGRDVSDTLGWPYDELYRDGSRFICEGEVMARSLRASGCPADRIRVVRIGIELQQFEFVVRERKTPFIIVQAARFVEKKGIDLSIRAFAAARGSLPPSELWLLGDGELRPKLEATARELGVAKHVRFVGMVSHIDYQAIIRSAHVSIQPSRTASNGDTEGGAPTVLLEMQASGVPIVATKHADIPFVVSRPDRLVDEEDVDALAGALEELASMSDDEYRSRAQEGRVFVEERHDARVTAAEIADIYREALSGR